MSDEYDRITKEMLKAEAGIESLKERIADLQVERLRCTRRHPLDFDRRPSDEQMESFKRGAR